MPTFTFELVSPARLIFSGEVDQVDVPGSEGDFGVLAGHAPLITSLRPGILTVRAGGGVQRLYVRGGFAEVNADGLTVLAEYAIPAEEVDAAREIEAAEQAISAAKDDASRDSATARLAQLRQALAEGSATRH